MKSLKPRKDLQKLHKNSWFLIPTQESENNWFLVKQTESMLKNNVMSQKAKSRVKTTEKMQLVNQ